MLPGGKLPPRKMDISEAIKQGRFDEALAAAKDAVRKAPTEAGHRSVLFQLYCLQGNWEGAQTQLKLVGDLDVETTMWAGVCEKLMACEAHRRQVYAGEKPPTFFGEPPAWVGDTMESFRLGLAGQWEAAAASQARALEAAPAVPLSVNGMEAEWVADADSRFGPLLEAFVDGKYFWIPFEHVRELTPRPRTHLMDAIWAPVDFEWLNQGKAAGFIPVRYFGSETHPDGMVRVGRKTEWEQKTENFYIGAGQRTLATCADDVPILELKTLVFKHPDQPMNFGGAASVDESAETLSDI